MFRSPGIAKHGTNQPDVLNSNIALTAPHYLNLAVCDDANILPEIINFDGTDDLTLQDVHHSSFIHGTASEFAEVD